MNGEKVKMFMQLAGQEVEGKVDLADTASRKLGAQLLLSEVLEYVIHGLGVVPKVNGQEIDDPNSLEYNQRSEPDKLEMLDGLADVGYTMYWNAHRFGLPIEKAFALVCDNNLQKFVELESSFQEEGELAQEKWDCAQGINWPEEVVKVVVVQVEGRRYAVGTDVNGKVRKPSSYQTVNLQSLLA